MQKSGNAITNTSKKDNNSYLELINTFRHDKKLPFKALCLRASRALYVEF